jgi:hypothetical protein
MGEDSVLAGKGLRRVGPGGQLPVAATRAAMGVRDARVRAQSGT